jgi:hypothetical protein
MTHSVSNNNLGNSSFVFLSNNSKVNKSTFNILPDKNANRKYSEADKMRMSFGQPSHKSKTPQPAVRFKKKKELISEKERQK